MMNNSTGSLQLLRLSQPFEDESFLGYCLRLAQLNHFESITWLNQLAGLRMSANGKISKASIFDDLADLSRLSALSGIEPEILLKLRYSRGRTKKSASFCGHLVDTTAIDILRPKICPQCLIESNHTRMVWDLAMVTCCPIHGTLLVDRCPNCGRKIDWYRKGINTCRCQYDLRNIEAQPATEIGRYISTIVHSLLDYKVSPPSIFTPLENLALGDLYSLVSLFCRFFSNHCDGSGSRAVAVEHMHANLEKVAAVFSNWPTNFIRFLHTADFKPAKNARFGLYHQFGNFYPQLKKMMGKASFAFIQEAFEKYQLKFFSKGYVRYQNLQVLNTYNAQEHLSRSETAKRLHTSERWVDQLLETGKLDGIKIESGNKHLILIKKNSADRLIARYKNALSMDAMKKVLRLKRKTIIQLINSDLLSSERGPSIDGFPRWMFTSRDLEGLFARIEKHIRPGAVQPDRSNLKTFSEARQMASAYQISSLEFYRLVVSGQLRPWARLPMLHIDSFLFEKSMVEKCVRDQREICLREGYTVKQFAELVGVSLDAAYKLEKEEVVKAQPSGQPKLGKIISKEAAEQFHSTHITSTAIAKQCGVSSNTVIKYLTRANKKPVFGPTVDGGPRYIYLRKDLADYDLSRIRASRRAKKYRRPVQLLLFDDVA